MESKYSYGRIYKLVDIGYSKCYIGSTIETLSNRRAKHIYSYRVWRSGKPMIKCCAFDMFEEFGTENVKIEEIEKYPCKDRDELLAREGYYIQSTDCINKKVAGRNFKGWYNDNREKCLNNFKNNYYKNIEERKAYKTTPFECECGSTVCLNHKARHSKTSKHQNYINQMNQQEQLK